MPANKLADIFRSKPRNIIDSDGRLLHFAEPQESEPESLQADPVSVSALAERPHG
jgi:hypothetical protein